MLRVSALLFPCILYELMAIGYRLLGSGPLIRFPFEILKSWASGDRLRAGPRGSSRTPLVGVAIRKNKADGYLPDIQGHCPPDIILSDPMFQPRFFFLFSAQS